MPEHHVSDIEFSDFVLEMRSVEGHPKYADGTLNFRHAENVFFNNFRIKRTF